MTWEEKIESLVKLAKAAGRFLDAERGTEGYQVTREHLMSAYDEFCDWRHEEPYVVDEIKALVKCDPSYTQAMDRLVMMAVVLLLPNAYGTRQLREALGLIRKLVQSCLELATGEEEADSEAVQDVQQI